MLGEADTTLAARLGIHELVLQQLRDGILEGRWPPGTRLKINDLAAELGVSPMPIREALPILAVEGLAVRTPRRGVVVSPLTTADVTNAYDIMGTLESIAAHDAATRLDEPNRATIERLCAQMEGLIAADDRRGLMRTNMAFHAAIYSACPNTWTREFLRQLWNYIYRVRHIHPPSKERLREIAAEHRAIIAALAARDADEAARLVFDHTRGARNDLLRRLDGAPLQAQLATTG